LHSGWWPLTGESDLGLFGALRIISADVANDPIFGLYGYGCEVTQQGDQYSITPKDGLCKRLNMVSLKLSVVLEQDQYSSAIIFGNKAYVELNLKNMKATAHAVKVSVMGLAAGNFSALVDNVPQTGTVASVAGKTSDFIVNLAAKALSNVKITNGTSVRVNATGASVAPELYIEKKRSGFIFRFNASCRLAGRPSLSIFNAKGALVAGFKDISGDFVVWNPRRNECVGGAFIVQLHQGENVIVRKLSITN
jgi:hypothetical protein